MDKKEKMICQKHNIEMEKYKTQKPMEDENGNWVFDKDGNPVMEDTSYYVCPICEEEENLRKYYDETPYMGAKIIKESIKKIEEKNPNQKTIKDVENKEDFLNKYTKTISDITDAPIEASKAMAQMLISCSLFNAKYENSKGKILPNLSIIWIAPSGSNKTPLIENTIEKVLPDVFPEFSVFGVVTGKGFRKEVSTWKDDGPIKPLTIIWDEMSTLSKDSKHEGTSDIYEVLSQAYDGKLSPYTSVRGGHERYPHLYSNLWISGVPSFLENTDKSFWYQGFGLRSLFLKYETVEPKDIKDGNLDDIKKFYEDIENDLKLMKKISFIKTTSDFMMAYNEYRKDVLKSIQEAQKDILRTEDPDVFPIISKVKFPVLIMKLSMINATSRYNFTEDGILTLEKEDFERAKIDLEKYHDNLVEMFNVWQELTETKSRIDNIKNLKDKIKRHILTLLSDKKGFKITQKSVNGEIVNIAVFDDNGKWVSRSALLRISHLSSKNFNELISTLIEEMVIQKKEGYIENRYIEIENTGYRYKIEFYSLI